MWSGNLVHCSRFVLIAVQVTTRIRAIASSSEGVEREEAPLLELELPLALAVVGLETFWNS